MLVWAASKRVPRDVLRTNIRPPDSPFLPWLTPSLQQYLKGRHSSSSSSSKTNSSSLRHNGTHYMTPPNRTYSTATSPTKAAAEAHATARIPDYYPPPFSTHGHQIRDSQQFMAPVDPMKVIILGTPEITQEHIPRMRNKNELHATLAACLSTGHLVRAHLILSQMSSLLERDSPILMDGHNIFLEALLKKAEKSRDMMVLFVWYEDKMKAQHNITGNATTFALLLKASLKIDPLQAQIYLDTYVQVWRETGQGIGDVLVLPILTDEEVIKIAKICKLRVSDLHETHRALLEEPTSFRPLTETLPEIASVATKGAGLAAVQHSLRSLTDPEHMPQRYSVSGTADIAMQAERQRLLEEDAFTSAQERWKKDAEMLAARHVLPIQKPLNALLWEWHQAFVPLIQEELVRVRAAEKDEKTAGAGERCLYGPFLRLLPPEKIAAIVMVELLKMHNSLGHLGLKTSQAVMHVGTMLETEYFAQEIHSRKNAELFQHVKNMGKQATGIFPTSRMAWEFTVRKAREAGPPGTDPILPEWPVTVKVKLGAVLLTMLLHCAKAPTVRRGTDGKETSLDIPAFCHTYQYFKGKKLGVIRLDMNLLKRLSIEPVGQGVLGRLLPMVVPPRPWKTSENGAYFYARPPAVRTKYSREQRDYVRTASNRGDLRKLFQGLDVLGSTAWKINRPVFDVLVEVWNSEEAFADIPPVVKDIVLPPEPPPSDNPKVRYKWMAEAREIKNNARNFHSQRCSVNFKIEIARAFLFDKFYFPHNVDFRGRAYPIPPNLNHIGDDLSRGLLMFGEGKELGDTGLRWLKIHLSNLCGVDKVSFDAREKFADDHTSEICDSADFPLKGKKWWLQAEEPWQCLSVCIALRDALAMPDPRKYVCHLPVAQDGTCNGLQHYAALGGDMMGAQQVNLIPSDSPSDVYTGVAELVKTSLRKHAEKGNRMAIILKDLITRKVVKQTVMTNVYGVTFVGARTQILNQLKDIPQLKEYDASENKVFSQHSLSAFVTREVFESVKTMFSGANEIQNWFATAARRISLSISPTQMDWNFNEKKRAEMEEVNRPEPAEVREEETVVEEEAVGKKETVRKKAVGKEGKGGTVGKKEATGENPPKEVKRRIGRVVKKPKAEGIKKSCRDVEFMTSVVWTTPLKLPVVQPYRRDRVQIVSTNLQNVYITDPNVVDEINARKQMTAFPPNFIHSLDATHMLMSAMMCAEAGLTFASVHDSFWTHPSDVDNLNRILRKAFIELHSGNVMENLKAEFELRYKGYRYLQPIPHNDPVTAKIKACRAIYAHQVLGKTGPGKKSILTMEEDLEWERSRDRLLQSEDKEDQARGNAMITPSVIVQNEGLVKNVIEDHPEVRLDSERPGEEETLDTEIGEIEAIDADEAECLEEGNEEGKQSLKPEGEANKQKQLAQTNVWMPLVFPPLPEKGDFKVELIEDSPYFFS